jgi:hypothetical protein
MARIPLPPADGAPYHCGAIVKVDPPVFWDRCPNLATHRRTEFKGVSLRCEEHTNTGDLLVEDAR